MLLFSNSFIFATINIHWFKQLHNLHFLHTSFPDKLGFKTRHCGEAKRGLVVEVDMLRVSKNNFLASSQTVQFPYFHNLSYALDGRETLVGEIQWILKFLTNQSYSRFLIELPLRMKFSEIFSELVQQRNDKNFTLVITTRNKRRDNVATWDLQKRIMCDTKCPLLFFFQVYEKEQDF